MNYTQYLQQGGTAQPSIEEQVAKLVQAAMSGDEQANQQINQIMQAAEQGDPKAQQIAQLIQQITQKLQQPATMKCGGKVRAKIKKACGGKKMEKGGEAKIKKEAKGGKPCPCILKKVGGKLIEVDCEGNPVIKAQAGTNLRRVNETAWHNKRYSSDEIKKIQAALNRQGLGRQIAVDGIFGKETLNAIRQFQQQHANELKVDGLAGDKTLSALGVSGISDSRIGQTRLGANQSRNNNPVSARDKQLREYYNSDQVWSWLQNASNARGQYADRYNQMAKEALNYLSPERASRLRYIANISPDAYDADTSAQHNFAKEREYGINMFKNAMANGQIKTAADYDNWMNKYHLSKEEMAELMLDPESINSSLVAGVRADNGRVNSQKAQANQLAKDVATAESKAGVGIINSLTPLSEGLYGTIKDVKDQGVSSLRPDKWLYNRLSNTILSGYTGGSPTYLTDIVPSTGNDFVDYAIDVATAPESWIGLGEAKNLSTKFKKPSYYKTTVKAGDVKIPGGEFYGGYIEGNPFNRTRMELHNYVKDPVYWKKGHNAGDLKSRGKLKFNYLPSEPYKVPGVHGVQLEYPNQMVNLQEVPSYDKGISYAPYLGYNRSKSAPVTYTDGSTMLPEVEVVAQRKEGGVMNYKQYINLK